MSLPTSARRKGTGAKVSAGVRETLQAAMESVGIEFTNGDGPGVRLKQETWQEQMNIPCLVDVCNMG